MKIFYKILVVISLIMVLMVLLIWYISVNVDNHIKDYLGNKTIRLTQDAISEVDRGMHENRNLVESYGYSLSIFREIANSNIFFDNLSNRVNYINYNDEEWTSLKFNETNKLIEEILQNEGSQRLDGIIKYNKQIEGINTISEIFVTNKYGTVVSSSDKTTDYNQADEKWWQVAKEAGLYLEDNAYDTSSNSSGVIIAIKLTDDDGNFVGEIKALITTQAIGKIIEESYENRTDLNEIKIITKNGRLIYQTNNTPYLVEDYSPFSFFKELKASSGLIMTKEEWDNISEEEEEEEIVLTYAISKGYEDFPGLNWTILVENSPDTVYPKKSLIGSSLFILSLIVLILFIPFAFYLSYLISRPISDISRKAKQISQGDLSQRLTINSNDEFGTLSKTIDKLMTDILKSKEELSILNLDLEKKVNERTKGLEDSFEEVKNSKIAILNMMEDLDIVNQGLKSLDKAKSEFLNIVSHELKTPLTAIMAHLGVLDDLKENLTKDQLDSLEAISRNTHELKFLISNILEISRMEAGKFELTKTPSNLEKIINDSIKNLEILAKQKNLKIESRLENLPKEILLDDTRITECMNNLLTNAIKFTEKGSISVSAKKEEENIIISVSDTGIGIPLDKQKRLFEKFYQVDASISRRYGGTGLGLSITKKIIEAHGGKISAESKLGNGTTFTIILPISQKNEVLSNSSIPVKKTIDAFSQFDSKIKKIIKERKGGSSKTKD